MELDERMAGKRPPDETAAQLHARLAAELWDRIDMLWTCHMDQPKKAAAVITAEISDVFREIALLAAEDREQTIAMANPDVAAKQLGQSVVEMTAQMESLGLTIGAAMLRLRRELVTVAAIAAGVPSVVTAAFFAVWYLFLRG